MRRTSTWRSWPRAASWAWAWPSRPSCFPSAASPRAAAARASASRRGLVTGALAGLVALAVHSVVDFNLRIPSNATLAALLAAFAASGAGLRERRVSRPALARGVGLAPGRRRGRPASSRGALGGETEWAQIRREVREADRAGSSEARALRVERSRARLSDMLARRPAFAEGWLLLAALRREEGRSEEARQLADHAVRAWIPPAPTSRRGPARCGRPDPTVPA